MLVALFALFALTSVLAAWPAHAATFPINETFGGSTTSNPNWVLSGDATLTNEGDGWLQLTSSAKSQSGTAVLNDAFPSTDGVYISFDYAVYGGISRTQDGVASTGDGFSFFLIDGTADPSVGALGAGLGYACIRSTTTGTVGACNASYPGVTGGDVGLGFDTFGQYSAKGVGNNDAGSPGRMPNNIVLRGSGSGTTGYAYLDGVEDPGGSLSGITKTDYRSAIITIIPNASGDPILTVTTNTGPGTAQQTVFSKFNLATASGQTTLPSTFKLGFSGGTGGATDYHDIRNLKVVKPVDLSIKKTGPASATVGDTITYQVVATNNGPNSAPGSAITDTVPAAIKNVTWTCGAAKKAKCLKTSGSGNDISVPVNLPVNGTATITITGTASAAGELANSANLTTPTDLSSTGATSVTNTAVVVACKACGDTNPRNNKSKVTTHFGALSFTGPTHMSTELRLGLGLVVLGAVAVALATWRRRAGRAM